MNATSTIIWTKIDEAPALATLSLLPIVQAFAKGTGVSVEMRDISLAGRIIANFPEQPDRGAADSRPPHAPRRARAVARGQHHQAAEHLRLDPAAQGGHQGAPGRTATTSRTTPRRPTNDAEKALQARFAKVLGSAVNPVLREGNSDRRSPLSVKAFSKKHPHKLGAWTADSQVPRRAHDRRRLLRQRELGHDRRRRPRSATSSWRRPARSRSSRRRWACSTARSSTRR